MQRQALIDGTCLAVLAAEAADVVVSALAVEAAGADGEPHQWVRMIPMGVFGGQRDARGPWVLDGPDHAAEVVRASMQRASGQDLVVDYDHQSEAALSDARTSAPAAGWQKELQARSDGIYAKVAWTEAAAAKLKAKEYRYISPVFGHETPRTDGQPMRVTRLLRAGLTNNPCLPELAAVAALHPNANPGTDMDIKKVAKALGLAETATEAEVETALAAIPAVRVDAGRIAAAAGLAVTARPDEVVTAVAALKAGGSVDPSKFIPRETYDALSVRVTTVEASLAEEKAVAAVDAAIEGGKVAPANREWAMTYAKRDLGDFQKFAAAQPAVVTPGRMAPRTGAPGAGGEVTVSADELAIASSMGLSKEAYLEAKKANAQ